MFKIKVPCYYSTENTLELENLGIDIDAEYLDLKDVIIYERPFLLSPYVVNSKEVGTRISVGNDYILTPLELSVVESLIEAQNGTGKM